MSRKKVPSCDMNTQRTPHSTVNVKKYEYYGLVIHGKVEMLARKQIGWLCPECAVLLKARAVSVQPSRQIKFEREREEVE